MPKRALPQVPRIPKLPTVEEPPQLSPTEEVSPFPRVDFGDRKIGDRPKKDDSLRGQPGGEFISPYMHHQRMDPSRQRREDGEQRERIQELEKERRRIDEEINEIRNQDTRINPYNVNRHVDETVQAIIADLRNMEQSPWSGNLDSYYGYSPLHTLFRDQFSVSEDEELLEEEICSS